MLIGVDNYNEGSVESVQFSRGGHVKAVARLNESGRFEIDLSIAPKWHRYTRLISFRPGSKPEVTAGFSIRLTTPGG